MGDEHPFITSLGAFMAGATLATFFFFMAAGGLRREQPPGLGDVIVDVRAGDSEFGAHLRPGRYRYTVGGERGQSASLLGLKTRRVIEIDGQPMKLADPEGEASGIIKIGGTRPRKVVFKIEIEPADEPDGDAPDEGRPGGVPGGGIAAPKAHFFLERLPR